VKHDKGLTRAGDILPAIIKPEPDLTPVQKRLLEATVRTNYPPIHLYQHTVFCQTCLPYRDPGEDKREWERRNGNIHLLVKAGHAMHPHDRRLVPLGLPFGPRCRLVLMHLNQRALLTQSPRIEVEDSLTAFVQRVLNLAPTGRNVRTIKQQLARLAASDITLGNAGDSSTGEHSSVDQVHIVRSFDVWLPKDERQRVLWPSTIDLSLDYFASLLSYAVPLNEEHIGALAHSALALDIYAWLTQRLHRIPLDAPAHVSWAALHSQFGQGYTGERGIRKFRQVFRVALKTVLQLYRDANVEDEEQQRPSLIIQGDRSVWREPPAQGLTLRHSKPPVPRVISPGA
jgi:hypothetical protein